VNVSSGTGSPGLFGQNLLRSLLQAHFFMLLISDEHDLTLIAVIIKYVSSAYFDITLPGMTVTAYETGPITEP